MNEMQNVALAKRWFQEVWNDRREETVHELLAAESVGHLEGGVDAKGSHEFAAVRAALLDALPDMRVTVDGMIGEGDHVAVRWTVSGTHLGGGFGFPASQKPVTFRGMTWLRFQDGRIVEGWDSWNQAALIQQLQQLQVAAVPA